MNAVTFAAEIGGISMSTLIPIIVVVGVILTLFILVAILAKSYIKVPPNVAAVFYGKKSKRVTKEGASVSEGFKVISGGAKFKWPIIEDVAYLALDAFQLEISLREIPNIDGVPVTIGAVATCKINSETAALMTAVERFLGKSDEEIQKIIRENLEGQLRAVVGTMTVEELIKNREKLNTKVKAEAGEELAKLGAIIDVLNIQSITDSGGYINALGKKRTAEVQRDADVGEAEAKRDADIGKAEAARDAEKASTTAEKEGAVVRAQNETLKFEAEKERDTKRAQYAAEVHAERAKAEQAGPKASAIAQQDVVVEEVKIEERKAQARIAVEKQNALVAAERQNAQEVVPAKKAAEAKVEVAKGDKAKMIIEAEANKDQAVIHAEEVAVEAEGEKRKTVLNAEAAKERVVLEADGNKAAEIARAEAESKKRELEGKGEGARVRAEQEGQADGIKALGEAEAAKTAAVGKAEAEKVQAVGLAEAKAIEAKLLAEAEGLEKKAIAYSKLDKAGALQMILSQLPQIIEAAEKPLAAIAAPVGQIDKIVMIDQSGGSGSKGGLVSFSQHVPNMLLGLVERCQESGIDLKGPLANLGLNIDALAGVDGKNTIDTKAKELTVKDEDDGSVVLGSDDEKIS